MGLRASDTALMGMIHTLRVSRHGREVLRLDRVAFPPGGVLAVLGKGGSGKSTLLRTLAGRLPAEAGWEVRMEGRGIPSPVTFVPQRRRDENRCWEIWGPPPCPGPLPEDCALARPCPPCRSAPGSCAATWSALFRESLCAPAPLLLLDEPEGGVPAYALESLALALRDLARRTTVVLATHHVGFAERVCDAALFLEDGTKLMQADREAFFHGPAHFRVREFLKWGG